MRRWLFPLLVGMVLGACVTGLAWSFAELEDSRDELRIPDVMPEPTEAVLWGLDVDGQSAP